jgi:hypothetical protein
VIFFWPHKEPPPPPKPAPRVTAATPPAAPASKPAPAPATVPAAKPVEPAAPAAVPTTSAQPQPGIAHVPINAVNKAKAVAAAQAATAVETDNVVSPPPTKAAPVPTASDARPAPNVAVTQLAPGVSATTATEAEPEASPAFRTFVANLHVSGVRSGVEPRAFINNRLVRKGEVVDSGLGITFEGVQEPELIFKDRSGATVKRRY